MRVLGNILWIIFGGLVQAGLWLLAGAAWCVTIIGIPLGLQCFKFASLSFLPFTKEVEYGGGAVSLVANVFWLLLTGIWMAAVNVIWGAVLCVTIIGIPFGLQCFKLAKLSLLPFGAKIVPKRD